MAINLFRKKNKPQPHISQANTLDIKALSKENRDRFIEDNKGFIYGAARKICRRNLSWENDDELSIALIAFNNACDTYNEKKGNFFSYAKAIINNSLIDSFRKNNDSPYLIFDHEDMDIDYIDNKNSLNEYEVQSENKNRGEEILLFTQELNEYSIDFNSLVDSSPSHKDTRDNLLNIALACIREDSILQHVKLKKKLPIKQILLLNNTNRKFLERWRIYIIALIIILSNNDYVFIKSYLKIEVGDKND